MGVGTGLGLAMVYGLVKQHKGFVHVYSEVGQGTTIKIYLRRVADTARDEADLASTGALPGGTEAILLLEDDDRLRSVTERLLMAVGYRVLSAEDGIEGLRLYDERRAEIALIVTDFMMPRLDGIRFYEALRARGARLSVLFTSGYPGQRFTDLAARDARVAFVTKPWTAGELLKTIRALLDAPIPRAT